MSGFVDYEKAFNRVYWQKLPEMLQDIREDWRGRRLIAVLYMGQTVTLRVAEEESDLAVTGRGV